MNLFQLPSIAATIALLSFPLMAADNTTPKKDTGKTAPAAGDLCNEFGNAKYAAKWAAGKVTLTAAGKHNTGGYEVSFQQSQIEIFPPQFSLVHKKPDGIVTQAITPFIASTSFPAAEKPKDVIVHDARGQQRVPVE